MNESGAEMLISIVVPIYNVKGYVERCIESIIGQSYKNIEIILVDDGSTDGCAGICDAYKEKDKRISVIHKKNGGVVSARKAGARAAQGEYIVTVDGDDWIEEDHVANIVNRGIIYNTDMIYLSGFYRDREADSVLEERKDMKGIYYGNEILDKFVSNMHSEKHFLHRNIWLTIWSWCIRKEIYLPVQESVEDDIAIGDDIVCMVKCILNCNSLVCIDESGYHYVKRPTSLINSGSRNDNKRIDVFWHQMKTEILVDNVNKFIKRVVLDYTFLMLFITDYRRVIGKKDDFLFPFIQVRKGSRIIIYGAGTLGRKLLKAIDEVGGYEVVLWVDKGKQGLQIDGYGITEPCQIIDYEYDYVVISITEATVSEQVEVDLIELGVPREKIAIMDYGAICEEALPEDMKQL